MKTLGFIPARGGSKGIPRKNLFPLFGKPLLQYTIEAAQASDFIDEIFLSSDDDEIVKFGMTFGLGCKYRRPADLAGDRAQIIDAVLDALNWLEDRGGVYDSVVLLQPTSPLRTVADIDGALSMFLQAGAESLVSVHRMTEHPYECIKRTGSEWRWLEKPPSITTGRQDYDQEYDFVNGAIYIAKVDLLRRTRRFIEEGKSLLYPMDPSHGIDIDEMHQLALAEFILTRDDAF